MFWNKYPYSNLHDLNLDWIIGKIKDLTAYIASLAKEIEDLGPEMQEYVNNWMDEHPEVTTTVQDRSISFEKLTEEVESAVGSYDGIITKIHHLESNTDTSYIILKIPRALYTAHYDNCSGDEHDTPVQLISDPLHWLLHHPEYDIATNCNYGGYDYSGRLHYADHLGTYNERPLLAYNESTDTYMLFPARTQIWDVPNDYETVFAIDETIVVNGEVNNAIEATNFEPRNIYGWNDDYYIIMITEGRGTTEKGMNLTNAALIMKAEGAQTAVNFDGGGSVCLAANLNGSFQKINKYRDQQLGFPEIRKVGVAQGFKRR